MSDKNQQPEEEKPSDTSQENTVSLSELPKQNIPKTSPSSQTSNTKDGETSEFEAVQTMSPVPGVEDSTGRKPWYALNLNFAYVKSVRGILHFFQLFFSMLVFSILSSACHVRPINSVGFAGFYCTKSDIFAFVIACSAFISNIVFVACCMLYRTSDELMYKSVHNRGLAGTIFEEFAYYMVYCALFLLSSFTLLSDVKSRNRNKSVDKVEYKYYGVIAAAVAGIINFILYGISSIWYLAYNDFFGDKQNSYADNPSNTQSTPPSQPETSTITN